MKKPKIALQELADVIEQVGNLIVITDIKGHIEYVNPTVKKVTGYSPEELIGKSPRIFKSGETSPGVYANLWKTITSGNIWHGAFSNRRKDGEAYWVMATISPLRNDQGEITHFVAVEEDITQLKTTQNELFKRTLDLERSNQSLKMFSSEMDSFAYIISHDLKAPLRGIASIGDWLCTDYNDKLDDQGRKFLHLLKGRVLRLQNLIEGVLSYSRIGRANEAIEDIDMDVIVRSVIDSLAPPKHIHVAIDGRLPTIHGQRIQLEQVFQNLISNAIKYMDKENGEVCIQCLEQGNEWEFAVADNGPGIDEKYFEKIFQIFQTLSPRDKVESTGVGLSIVKKIIERHWGRIWVTSTIGQGSTFHFTLPK